MTHAPFDSGIFLATCAHIRLPRAVSAFPLYLRVQLTSAVASRGRTKVVGAALHEPESRPADESAEGHGAWGAGMAHGHTEAPHSRHAHTTQLTVQEQDEPPFVTA